MALGPSRAHIGRIICFLVTYVLVPGTTMAAKIKPTLSIGGNRGSDIVNSRRPDLFVMITTVNEDTDKPREVPTPKPENATQERSIVILRTLMNANIYTSTEGYSNKEYTSSRIPFIQIATTMTRKGLSYGPPTTTPICTNDTITTSEPTTIIGPPTTPPSPPTTTLGPPMTPPIPQTTTMVTTPSPPSTTGAMTTTLAATTAEATTDKPPTTTTCASPTNKPPTTMTGTTSKFVPDITAVKSNTTRTEVLNVKITSSVPKRDNLEAVMAAVLQQVCSMFHNRELRLTWGLNRTSTNCDSVMRIGSYPGLG
ncbi:uncharacterized protein O3C94_005877 [Discoglossus pictus]